MQWTRETSQRDITAREYVQRYVLMERTCHIVNVLLQRLIGKQINHYKKRKQIMNNYRTQLCDEIQQEMPLAYRSIEILLLDQYRRPFSTCTLRKADLIKLSRTDATLTMQPYKTRADVSVYIVFYKIVFQFAHNYREKCV
jgi:hypothetical protein